MAAVWPDMWKETKADSSHRHDSTHSLFDYVHLNFCFCLLIKLFIYQTNLQSLNRCQVIILPWFNGFIGKTLFCTLAFCDRNFCLSSHEKKRERKSYMWHLSNETVTAPFLLMPKPSSGADFFSNYLCVLSLNSFSKMTHSFNFPVTFHQAELRRYLQGA